MIYLACFILNFSIKQENLFFVFISGFPSQPKDFKVKSKSNGSVTLQWKSPDLNDLNAKMLQYVLMCDRENFTQGF